MGNRPVGVGRGWNIPLPCRSHLWLNGIRQATPPPPGAFRASARPLPRGRAVHGDSSDTVPRGKTGSSRSSRLKPGEGNLSRGAVSMGNRPVGEGLTGRGMEHPPPLSRRVTEDVFPCEQSITPRLPARSAPPPAPFRGGGRVFGDSSDAVPLGKTGFFGEFHA